MNEVDGHRAFANGGGNSLHRGSSHITRNEHACQARLQRQWLPLECPARGNPVAQQLGAGNDETPVVTGDRLADPGGVRLHADEDGQQVRWHLLF